MCVPSVIEAAGIRHMSSHRFHHRSGKMYCLQRERLLRRRPWSLSVYDFGLQLERLLDTGADRDRVAYFSLVDEIVASHDPLALFSSSERQSGVRLIEAVYYVHRCQASAGDDEADQSLAPLCYSRWVAWRNYGAAVGPRARVLGDQRRVGDFIDSSRLDVCRFLRAGWQPKLTNHDEELACLVRRWSPR